MNLRKLARDKPCQVRLPGCNGGGETTVLAHYRLGNYCGAGLKPSDWFGAWACSACHDLVDFRVRMPDASRAEIRLAHAEGVLRTQEAIRKQFPKLAA